MGEGSASEGNPEEKGKKKKKKLWLMAEVKTEKRKLRDKRERRAGEQSQHFSLSPPPPPPSPLSDSNLILGPAESLKPFTWSGRDMKIDNCDLLFLPGKQKREAGVTGRPVLL